MSPLPPVHTRHPPLSVVRKFAHLLNQSQEDFLAEAELLKLQGEVVRKIRSNQQLEQDLNLMDIKIGLLVKNRITLQVRDPDHPSPSPAAPIVIQLFSPPGSGPRASGPLPLRSATGCVWYGRVGTSGSADFWCRGCGCSVNLEVCDLFSSLE